jgi:ankyrin repeat protein
MNNRLDDKLLAAIAMKSFSGVRRSLLAGASPFARTHRGDTALMAAAKQGFPEAMMAVIGRSAINAVNMAGRTALMEAADVGSIDCVRILAPLGDAKAMDQEGRDALMIAAARGHAECVALLLPVSDPAARQRPTTSGAARPTDGFTALHFAAASKSVASCKALAAVSDIDARSDEGKTPLLVAAERALALIRSQVLPKEEKAAALMVQALVAAGARLAIDNDGLVAKLHAKALRGGRTELASALGAAVAAEEREALADALAAGERTPPSEAQGKGPQRL